MLNKALDKVSPKRKIQIANKDFFWYTQELKEVKKKVNKLYIRALRTRKLEDKLAYKKEQKYYRKRCKKDKRNSWHRYIDGINSAKDIAKLNRILGNKASNNLTVFDKEDGLSLIHI